MILLLGQVNEQWLLGKLLEAEGIFPASFVDVVKPPSDNVELSAMVTEYTIIYFILCLIMLLN